MKATTNRSTKKQDDWKRPELMVKYVTDPKMLELLVCPVSGGLLHYDKEHKELVSKKAGLAFPIRDGIPVMLVSEARPLEENET